MNVPSDQPFEINPRAKLRMVCRTCRSPEVLCDAFAYWDELTQEWSLDQTFDKGAHCLACDGETRIEQVELDESDVEHSAQAAWDEDTKVWEWVG